MKQFKWQWQNYFFSDIKIIVNYSHSRSDLHWLKAGFDCWGFPSASSDLLFAQGKSIIKCLLSIINHLFFKFPYPFSVAFLPYANSLQFYDFFCFLAVRTIHYNVCHPGDLLFARVPKETSAINFDMQIFSLVRHNAPHRTMSWVYDTSITLAIVCCLPATSKCEDVTELIRLFTANLILILLG